MCIYEYIILAKFSVLFHMKRDRRAHFSHKLENDPTTLSLNQRQLYESPSYSKATFAQTLTVDLIL